MRKHILLAALVLNLIFWGILSYHPEAAVQAHGACADTYTVQYGDWLAAIARRFNTSINELLALNPKLYWRMNLLYPGEVLCLPAQPHTLPSPTPPPLPTPPPSPVLKNVVSLETEFNVPPLTDMTVTLQAPYDPLMFIGERETLSLQQTDGISGTSAVPDIAPVISGQPAPMLLVFRNLNAEDKGGDDFTLYEVGNGDILSAVRYNPSVPLKFAANCESSPIAQVFGLGPTDGMAMTAWLEGAENVRAPFHISKVARIDPEDVVKCTYNQDMDALQWFAFAVLPGNNGQPNQYRLFVNALNNGGPEFYDNWRFLLTTFGFR